MHRAFLLVPSRFQSRLGLPDTPLITLAKTCHLCQAVGARFRGDCKGHAQEDRPCLDSRDSSFSQHSSVVHSPTRMAKTHPFLKKHRVGAGAWAPPSMVTA